MSATQFVVDLAVGVRDSLGGLLSIWTLDGLSAAGASSSFRKSSRDDSDSVDSVSASPARTAGSIGGGNTILARRRQQQQESAIATAALRAAELEAKSRDEQGAGEDQAASSSAFLSPPSSGSDSTIKQKPGALRLIVQCQVLNIGFFLFFQYALTPAVWSVFSALASRVPPLSAYSDWLPLRLALHVSWLIPLTLTARVASLLWFQDIANVAARRRNNQMQQQRRKLKTASTSSTVGASTIGSGSAGQGPFTGGSGVGAPGGSVSRSIADFVLAILLEFLFLIQAETARYIPVPAVGAIFRYAHLCLLYSLYAYEYLWMHEGLELGVRLYRIQCDIPYHLGFGGLLVLITALPKSFIFSGCLFAGLFPILIVSSFFAKPRAVEASPWPQVHIFGVCVYFCNAIFACLNRRGGIKTTGSKSKNVRFNR